MLYAVVSPAKKLAEDIEFSGDCGQPQFKKETAGLIKILKDYTPAKLASLMHISDKLAHLNYVRYQEFKPSSYTAKNATPAVLLFQGDVYQGMQAETFNKTQIQFCQKTLGILSGLYGLLRPLDLIQPYRLEMGTKLKNPVGADLYAYWRELVTDAINTHMQSIKAKFLINLASDEYFSVIDKNALNYPIIKVDFKENKNDKLKTIGLFAKRARGAMVRYMVENRCKTVESLQSFDLLDYQFNKSLSTDSKLVFVR